VRWEDFRADIEAMTETEFEERKSNAGRKPYDALLRFKIVVLQSLHNLSDALPAEVCERMRRDGKSVFPAHASTGDPNGPFEACPLIRSHAR
jgi:hypothetical protein